MIPSKSRNVPPKASAMIEALRGLGYTSGSALADLVDNSIAAHATDVAISFFWKASASRITVLDNGDGMDEASSSGLCDWASAVRSIREVLQT